MIWQVSSKGDLQPIWMKIDVKRRGNGDGGVNTTDHCWSGMGILKRKKAFLHLNVNLSSSLLSRFILSGAFYVFSHMFSDFFFLLVSPFRVEWCLLSSPKHCVYSHISPWICSFHMAFPSPFLFPFPFCQNLPLFLKNKKFFSFSSESLYFILSETPWLILFLLLSPLVHKTSMKRLSNEKLSE